MDEKAAIPRNLSGPLNGIRVLDWTAWHQGPVAASMLGDLGAEVIKIEDPVTGDPGRSVGLATDQKTGLSGGRNYFFEAVNRGKKAITLNLKHPAAREILYRLVTRSDVFIHNFREKVALQLGVDYETLARHNRRLIYAVGSGYGPRGPHADRPCLNAAALARSGLMASQSTGFQRPPVSPPGGTADQLGGTMLAYGVLAALVARERIGIGQRVDISLLNSTMWFQILNVCAALFLGQELQAWDRSKPANPLFNSYQCKDGRWLFFALVPSDRFWRTFCEAVGLQHIEHDPRFRNDEARRKNRFELVSMIEAAVATKTSAEWAGILYGYQDFVFDVVKTVAELASDEQVLANGYIVDVDHPDLGRVKVLGPAAQFSHTPSQVGAPAPVHGQHTEEVLISLAGYTWDELERLREQGAI